MGHTCNNPCARKPANHITQRVERHFGQSGPSPPTRIAIWPAGETPVREVEKAVFCLKPTKKADVLRAARRRLLLFTPGGQFPNQAEKLSGSDTSRNSPALFRRGYVSFANSANNLRTRECFVTALHYAHQFVFFTTEMVQNGFYPRNNEVHYCCLQVEPCTAAYLQLQVLFRL